MDYYSAVTVVTLLALGILSILISENDRISREKIRLFIAANVLIGLAAVAEYLGVYISGKADLPKCLLAAVKAVDYTLTPMTGGALIVLMQKPRTRNRLLPCLFIGNAVMQAISAFQGWMVVIDDQNHYTHGPLYPVYTVFYLLIIIILAVKMLAYGRSFRRQNRKSLYAIVFLILIGIGIQEVLRRGCRVSYLALTFAAAFLFIHYSEFSQLQLDDQLSAQEVKISNDPLTGALSRFAYMDALSAYAGCIPDDLAVFMIDINGLKSVNDSIGHEAGDELICGAAQCIAASIGKNGRTFRIGGDEFVVFTSMPREAVKAALNDLRRKTQAWSGKRVEHLSLSAGYALACAHKGISVEALVKEADKRMYVQKKAYYQTRSHDRRP